MFQYDESLEQSVAGWIQRVVGALLAAAVLAVIWVTRAGLTRTLTGRLSFGIGTMAFIGLAFLTWCGLVAVRLLSGAYGRRSLMPAWMFIVVGILFGILSVLLLALAFVGHVDVGADAVLATLAITVGGIHVGIRKRRDYASRP